MSEPFASYVDYLYMHGGLLSLELMRKLDYDFSNISPTSGANTDLSNLTLAGQTAAGTYAVANGAAAVSLSNVSNGDFGTKATAAGFQIGTTIQAHAASLDALVIAGIGALASLNNIDHTFVTDFNATARAQTEAEIIAGANVTITPAGSGASRTLTIAASLSGGAVSGPGSSVSGALVVWNGTAGAVLADSAAIPSANGKSLISATDYAAMRSLLGLGTVYPQNVGTSGANVPLLSTANTWTLAQTFTAAPVFSDAPNTRAALGLASAALQPATAFEPSGAYSGINTQTGTTYTLVLTDQGKLVTMSNAASNVLTIPPNSSVAFPARARVDLASLGAGQTSIAAGAGVTIQSSGAKLKLTAQFSGGSLVQLSTDTWLLVGDLST